MEDSKESLIWRCIKPPKKLDLIASETFTFLTGTGPGRSHPKNMVILQECRPYELGWLLYAFAPELRSQGARV
jgi:hypothetical protein